MGRLDSRSRGTILVVDEEEMIRNVSAATLETFGFKTLVAADGDEALEIFLRQESRISMVLLDQSKPRLSVFNELRRIRPEIRILLASTDSEQEVSKRFKGLELDGFLQKPFTVKRLLDEVQRILEEIR